MNGSRRRWLALAALALAGCAQLPPRAPGAAFWQGRLALRIDGASPQSFFAGFDLQGTARQGSLLLTGPLGQTVAQLAWTPDSATLREDGNRVREFGSLQTLAAQATGTSLPISALFDWLAGRDVLADGWQADLSQLGEGRLTARRLRPEPAAELRLVIESTEARQP